MTACSVSSLPQQLQAPTYLPVAPGRGAVRGELPWGCLSAGVLLLAVLPTITEPAVGELSFPFWLNKTNALSVGV